MAATGVIGLGVMGRHDGCQHHRSGSGVHITGRSQAKYGDLIAAGAVWHDTARSLTDAVGVIVSVLARPARGRGGAIQVPTASLAGRASTTCS
jgi:3-hydroxyisobutyrate dehydrogenase-like beta-hydroxyacid dehydrogenase